MDEITNTEVPTQETSVPTQETSVPTQQEQPTEKAPEVATESPKEETLPVENVQSTESLADKTFTPNAENTPPPTTADTPDNTTTSPATTENKPYEHKPAYQRSNDNYHQRNNDRGDGYRKPDKFERNSFSKDRDMRGGSGSKFKKYDKIAAKKLDINYKKPEILQDFLTEKGKILSRLITGCSAQNQHKLTCEVKRARFIGLLPSA